MLHKFLEPGAWFMPKRYGYGAGLPIAWQGWVVLAVYFAAMLGTGRAITGAGPAAVLAGTGFMLAATCLLVVVVRRRTRGKWRWRWGDRD